MEILLASKRKQNRTVVAVRMKTHRQLKQCLTTQTYGTNNIPMECNMRQSKQNRVWKQKY